jgi:hypothetical protein
MFNRFSFTFKAVAAATVLSGAMVVASSQASFAAPAMTGMMGAHKLAQTSVTEVGYRHHGRAYRGGGYASRGYGHRGYGYRHSGYRGGRGAAIAGIATLGVIGAIAAANSSPYYAPAQYGYDYEPTYYAQPVQYGYYQQQYYNDDVYYQQQPQYYGRRHAAPQYYDRQSAKEYWKQQKRVQKRAIKNGYYAQPQYAQPYYSGRGYPSSQSYEGWQGQNSYNAPGQGNYRGGSHNSYFYGR